MNWEIVIYLIGVLAFAILSGYLTDTKKEITAKDSIAILFACLIWPILLIIGIVGGLARIGQNKKKAKGAEKGQKE